MDATTRRAFEWSDGTTGIINLIVDSTNFEITTGWSTTVGDWTIATPTTGAEHNILITYDGAATTNNPVVYVDGSSVTVTKLTAPVGTLVTAAKVFTIGNRTDHTRAFNGWISTVAIWNTILAAADATALNNGAAPCAVQNGNIVAYWPLNAGDSPEVELFTANTLTVTGTTVVSGSTVVTNPRCHSASMGLLGVGR